MFLRRRATSWSCPHQWRLWQRTSPRRTQSTDNSPFGADITHGAEVGQDPKTKWRPSFRPQQVSRSKSALIHLDHFGKVHVRATRSEVPFERPGSQVLPPSQHGLTRTERSAFVRLENLRAPMDSTRLQDPRQDSPRVVSDGPRTKPKRRSQIDAILDAMNLEEGKGIHSDGSVDSDVNLPPSIAQHSSATKSAVSTQEFPDFEHISRKLEGANSDLEIWHILIDNVLGPMTALQLDKARSGVDGFMPDDLNNIGRAFAHALLLAAQSLRRDFPASSVQLAIIPELRGLGPTIFTLGVSTDLYNEHLEHITKQDDDLGGTLELLDEMDRGIIEPDQKTVSIIDEFRTKLRKVRNGDYGPAINAIWTTEGNRRIARQIHSRGEKFRAIVKEKEAIALA